MYHDGETGRATCLGTGIADLHAAKRYLRRKFNLGELPPIQRRPGARFYVSARAGSGIALLFGPYSSHMTALAKVPEAVQRTRDTAFAAVGTTSALVTLPTRYGR